MGDAAAEKELQRLRRLPKNKTCPNCLKTDNYFGFSAVVVPFRTFVCSDCKSAHQAFSHRCKSITMSNWTMEEVVMLDERNGGGNRVAGQRWLARVPPGERPKEGGNPNVLKAFIDRAYNQKAWEAQLRPQETEAPASSDLRGSDEQSRKPPQPVVNAARTRAIPAAKVAAQSPAPEANLLDFDVSTPAQQTPQSTSTITSGDLLGDFSSPSVPAVSAGGAGFAAPSALAGHGAGVVTQEIFDPFGAPGSGGLVRRPAPSHSVQVQPSAREVVPSVSNSNAFPFVTDAGHAAGYSLPHAQQAPPLAQPATSSNPLGSFDPFASSVAYQADTGPSIQTTASYTASAMRSSPPGPLGVSSNPHQVGMLQQAMPHEMPRAPHTLTGATGATAFGFINSGVPPQTAPMMSMPMRAGTIPSSMKASSVPQFQFVSQPPTQATAGAPGAVEMFDPFAPVSVT